MSEPLPPPAIPSTAGFNPAEWAPIFEQWGFSGFIGARYESHGPDWVELALPWRADLTVDEDSGLLSSGPIITMLDLATSSAVWARLDQPRPQATMDLRVDYLAASPPGATLYAWGQCTHVTHQVAFVRGVAHNGDRDAPIALCTGTFIRTAAMF